MAELKDGLSQLRQILAYHCGDVCRHQHNPHNTYKGASITTTSATSQKFRFLELPQEVQDEIYERYFENTSIGQLAYDAESHMTVVAGFPARQPSSRLQMGTGKGITFCQRCGQESHSEDNYWWKPTPCLNLALTCRKIYEDIWQVRERILPPILKLNAAHWNLLAPASGLLLHRRVRTVVLKYSHKTSAWLYGGSWARVALHCPQLRHFYLDMERDYVE